MISWGGGGTNLIKGISPYPVNQLLFTSIHPHLRVEGFNGIVVITILVFGSIGGKYGQALIDERITDVDVTRSSGVAQMDG